MDSRQPHSHYQIRPSRWATHHTTTPPWGKLNEGPTAQETQHINIGVIKGHCCHCETHRLCFKVTTSSNVLTWHITDHATVDHTILNKSPKITFGGVCLNYLDRPLLSEVQETDGAIATSQGHQVRLMGVSIHATQRHILTRTAYVGVCVCMCE